VDIKGKGKLAAYAVVSVGAPMMAEEGFDRNNPYCSGVVELEEGPKVSARLLGFDLASPDKIKIGTPVSLEFVERGEGEEKKSFLAFKKV
jgi:uncharacterized OB-fold protein